MPRKIAIWKQSDVEKAQRASRNAGLEVVRTEVNPDGRIVLFHKVDGAVEPADATLEAWKAKRNARQA
jgi:hypothetical protein